MPTYDYRCNTCQKTWEHFQGIKSEPVKECPYCKNQTADRLISTGGGVLFRGPGFYHTDYKLKEQRTD